MKKQLLTLSILFTTYFASAQVGIGTTSPSNDLDVEGSGAAANAIDINNTSTGDPKINLQISGTTTFSIGIDNSDSDKLKIGTTAVETNTAITIDASQNVGVGTSSPISTLDVQGSMGLKVSTITAATTLNSTHNVVLCNTGAYTVTLPAAASNTGRTYYIKNIDFQGDDITIDGNSSETIDGSTTYILTTYQQNVRIISDGSSWHVVAGTLGATIAGNAICSGKTISATSCANVSGATINDNVSTADGIEYNWTGATTSGMANTSTTRALVEIGGQCWMRYNMDIIPASFNPAPTWVNNSDVGWSGYYTGGPFTDEGRLYQWKAAMNNVTTERDQGICPTGWHIPSDCEIMYLENSLGMSIAHQQAVHGTDRNTGTVGSKLLASGTNTSGFSALLAGGRNLFNSNYEARGTGTNFWASIFWTSTLAFAGNPYFRELNLSTGSAYRHLYPQAQGMTVRCLKD